jgi:hypothetical protein
MNSSLVQLWDETPREKWVELISTILPGVTLSDIIRDHFDSDQLRFELDGMELYIELKGEQIDSAPVYYVPIVTPEVEIVVGVHPLVQSQHDISDLITDADKLSDNLSDRVYDWAHDHLILLGRLDLTNLCRSE